MKSTCPMGGMPRGTIGYRLSVCHPPTYGCFILAAACLAYKKCFVLCIPHLNIMFLSLVEAVQNSKKGKQNVFVAVYS